MQTVVQRPAPAASNFATSNIPDTLYLTVSRPDGELKRKTLHFRAIHKKKGYWVGRNVHLFYAEGTFGVGFVLAKLPPDREDPIIYAHCTIDGPVPVVPPLEKGWKSERWPSISIKQVRPQVWTEGDSSVKKEKIAKLFAVVRKERNRDGDLSLSIRDICRNIEAVKEHLPELLTDFPKIDFDGNGKVSLEELDHYFDNGRTKEYTDAKLDEMWEILTSRPQASYAVGEEIRAVYSRYWMATIDELKPNGTIVVSWDDGDVDDRIKQKSQVRKIGSSDGVFKEGDRVEAEYLGWYRAIVERVVGDGSYQVKWADGDESDRFKKPEEMRKLKAQKAGARDKLTLEDMAANIEYIEEKLPEIFDSFQSIDVDQSCSISRHEFDAFFGSTDTWLKAHFDQIIGLEHLKEQLLQFYWQQRLDRMRRRGGAMVNNDEAMVIMFKGNPGTGKTTIGRLLTGLLSKIGVIPTENFVEVQRDELVGDHIGATEKLTAAKIEEARGGVLFVDEAYRLNSDTFGVEAINGLMKAMTVKGTVMILAGYPAEMEAFTAMNPGIKRRITYEMEFEDYSHEDLAQILRLQIFNRGFEVDVPLEKMSTLISQHTNSRQRRMLNGGIGEHISRHAIFHLNERQMDQLKQMDDSKFIPSVCLSNEDIEFGCKHIPDPPEEWTQEIEYSQSYKQSIERALGCKVFPTHVVKTAQSEELQFCQLETLQGSDLKIRFPIKVKKDPKFESLM